MLLLHVFSSLWHVEAKGLIAIHTTAITEQTSGRNGGPGGSAHHHQKALDTGLSGMARGTLCPPSMSLHRIGRALMQQMRGANVP